jgi:predicted metal-binding protein
MSSERATVFVCVSCRIPIEGDENAFNKPGAALAEAIAAHLRDAGASEIDVRPVECLAVCKRPCTIAFAAKSKWTYVIGGIDANAHAEEIANAARSFAASVDGIVPWKERPLSVRKVVIARVPPEMYQLTGNAE